MKQINVKLISNFQEWLVNHIPSKTMKYEREWTKTYCFWRDRIIEMFYPFYSNSEYYNTRGAQEMNTNVQIVGEHYSKSIVHPVVRIKYKGTEIVFRCNFYDYEIAVISDHELNIPMSGLFTSKVASFYYQGFPKEYKLKERYEENKCKFMAYLCDNYQFYTFMYILKQEIDKIKG